MEKARMAGPSDELDDRALELALEVEEQLESNPLAALDIAEHAPPDSAAHPEVRLARARALLAAKGPTLARPILESLAETEPRLRGGPSRPRARARAAW